MKTRINELLISYREIYRGPNWIEVSLQPVLADVDSTLAFTDPPGNRNSIAKIVCHLVFIRQYLIKKLQGDLSTVIDQDKSFNTAAYGSHPETAWQNLQEELARTFQEITDLLPAAEPALLEKQVLPRDYSFDYLIAGIIQHEAYHTGQLEFLKKQLQQLALNK
ncbi:DinB family protein [Adhaeribacter pallidiroseus]|uniref:DinB-like domain-containing protein n=1 Tax=Adhaeribacter pallidiroseus TaxID=2072847 RepID=A0A369QSJ6_9BACT|nr:DinB family protein [Adhaeribacter pallidiroseus]RDC66306.1 hypothetical protein AHMF7616_04937 [Adhaeribacter pallidiroseus]